MGKTYVWGYQRVSGALLFPGLPTPVVGAGTGRTQSYLGPVVVAGRHTPTAMTFINQLPDANLAKVKAYTTSTDQTLIWGDPLGLDAFALQKLWLHPRTQPVLARGPDPGPARAHARQLQQQLRLLGPAGRRRRDPSYASPVPAAVHIHGGEVPSVLDGGPDSWWTPNGIYGHGYYTRHVNSLPTFQPAVPTLPGGGRQPSGDGSDSRRPTGAADGLRGRARAARLRLTRSRIPH